MKIIVNGIGCNLSGGKVVLFNLLRAHQEDVYLSAFASAEIDVTSLPNYVNVWHCNHKVFGQFFRPLFDVFISLYSLLFGSGVVLNLSNYGLPLFNREILYFHNPLLVDEDYYATKSGFAIMYKRFALLYSLKKAKAIIVQTEHMEKTLQSFMGSNGIDVRGRIVVLKPFHTIPQLNITSMKESCGCEFFYPASSFPHKRADLAVDGLVLSRSLACLKITVDGVGFDVYERVSFLGKIDYSSIIDHFNTCDALLFTSEVETLGLPLLEALSLSKPAVLPNVPYAKEIYGDAGVYFDSFEPIEVAKAIDFLVSNIEEYKERVALRKVKEFTNRLSWEQQWEVIQEKILYE